MLKNDLRESPVAVGDNVEFAFEQSGLAMIETILPRKQILRKPEVYLKKRQQVIAANMDQLVIITSTTRPTFKPGLVDRFLVSAENDNLEAIVVINKIDLRPAEDFQEYLQAWNGLGYRVICVSAKTGQGIEDLSKVLQDKESALAGHSGVGKSSLLNAIDRRLVLKISDISDATGRGVHTTSYARMYHLGIGGWVVDTPGLKVFSISPGV